MIKPFADLPIYGITLPTPFQVGDVHCWLIKDDKIVLVDCGPLTHEAYHKLHRSLHELGLTFSDIDELWLTHGHPDHFGLAKRLSDGFTIPVAAHAHDRFLFEHQDVRNIQHPIFTSFGVPEPQILHYRQQWEWFANFFQPIIPNRFLESGQRISTGVLEFTVLHTPGHSPGHISFLEPHFSIIISGDVLIQHISTNAIITVDPNTGKRRDTLAELRQSMTNLSHYKASVLPGHGRWFQDSDEVVAKHFLDHDKRLERLLSHSTTPKTVYQLSLDLFPFGTDPKVSFLTVSETIGHIDRALREGLLEWDASSNTYLRTLPHALG